MEPAVKSISLTEDEMKNIKKELDQAAKGACSSMTKLIESLEEQSKKAQIHRMKEATQAFIKLYNELLLSSITENCDDWRESDNGIVNTVKRLDPGNEDAITSAFKFEEEIKEIAEGSIESIDEFNCTTANPTISQLIYDECATEFSKALNDIKDLYDDKKSVFNNNAEQNVLYECCSEVLVVMLKSFEGVYEGGREIFKNLGETAGLNINKVFMEAKQAATIAVSKKNNTKSMTQQLSRVSKAKK